MAQYVGQLVLGAEALRPTWTGTMEIVSFCRAPSRKRDGFTKTHDHGGKHPNQRSYEFTLTNAGEQKDRQV